MTIMSVLFSATWPWTAVPWVLTGLGICVVVAIATKRLVRLRYYGIQLGQQERHDAKLQYKHKVVCLAILILLDMSEAATGHSHSGLALLISSVVTPFTLTLTLLKANYKLSLPSDVTGLRSTYAYSATIFVAATLNFIQKLLWVSDWADDLKIYLVRLIILLLYLYEPVKPLKEKAEGETNKTEKPNVDISLFSIISKFYHLRAYILPSSTKGIIFGTLFGCVILIESIVHFYNNLYSMKIVNSLQLRVGNSSNETAQDGMTNFLDELGSARLEFRWDFILIFYILRFLDSTILYVAKHYLERQTQAESCNKLQLALFTKLQNLSLRWHLENQTSEIFTLMTSSAGILRDIISSSSWLIPTFLNVLVTLTYMVRVYSFKISSVVVLSGLVSGMCAFLVTRRQDHALKELKEAESKVRKAQSATFENYETMKYFTNEEYERKNYEKMCLENRNKRIHDFILFETFRSTRTFVRTGAELLVILIVVKGILGGEEGLTPGDYVYFSNVFSSLLWPLNFFLTFYKRLQGYAFDMDKIAAALDLVPEIADEPNAPDLEIDETGGSIEFKNVYFSYVPERQVIKDFSIFIPAGSTVAFVGRSGSGKSTITKLLFRFYDTTSGEIFVNGQNIKKVKSMSLRKAMGVVPQEVVLFANTIKHNIQYGRMDATVEEIEDAAKAASLHDRITSFPDKYETEVGNRGLKLSGGEKQRVAIARAILRNPPIMVLDEATSSLDTKTEKQIQATLESLYDKRTTIIIAHRLSTIVNVDTIFVVDEGSIVESGSHSELLDKNGAYTAMWNTQIQNSFTTDVLSDSMPIADL